MTFSCSRACASPRGTRARSSKRSWRACRFITGDLPGPTEIVRHEANGLVVKTGDADALAQAMTRAVVDRDLRQTLRAGARASATRFDQSMVLPELAAALCLE